MMVQDEIKFMTPTGISKLTDYIMRQYTEPEMKPYIDIIDAQLIMKMRKLQAK